MILNPTLRRLRVAPVLLACVLTAACTRPHVTQTALEFNKAMSDFSQKEILLNAVRASKNRPLQYSAISSGSGTLTRDARLSGNFSFADALAVPFQFTGMLLSPSVSASKSHVVSLSNLNSKEFIAKMQQDVTPEMYNFFLKRDIVDEEALNMLFIREIYILKKDFRLVRRAYEQRCRKSLGSARNRPERRRDRKLCGLVKKDQEMIIELYDRAKETGDVEMERVCELHIAEKIRDRKTSRLWFPNFPKLRCNYLAFRSLFRMMRVLDLKVESGKKTVSSKPEESTELIDPNHRRTDDERRYNQKARAMEIKRKITVSKPLIFKLEAREATAVSAAFKVAEGKTMVALRSPQEIIDYLGHLIVVQTHPQPLRQYIPNVVQGIAHEPVVLFHVVKGATTGAAVSVVDDDGERYSVPRPEFGSKNEDRSLQVLSFLSDLIALQTRREDLPASSTISLIQ